MGVAGLDHVNIRTSDPAASAAFYEQALGLRYRTGDAGQGHRLHWLYDEAGSPIIHLREMAPGAAGGGSIDHVALRCTDRASVKARLEAMGIGFAEGPPRDGRIQLFVRDPHDVTLELSFPAVEA